MKKSDRPKQRPIFIAKFAWLGLALAFCTPVLADEATNQNETINQTIAEIRQISEEIRQLNQEIQQNKALLQQLNEEQNNQPNLSASQINLNSVVAPEITYSTLDNTLQQVANVESEQALLALNEEIHQLSEEIRQLNQDIAIGKQTLEQLNQDIQNKKR